MPPVPEDSIKSRKKHMDSKNSTSKRRKAAPAVSPIIRCVDLTAPFTAPTEVDVQKTLAESTCSAPTEVAPKASSVCKPNSGRKKPADVLRPPLREAVRVVDLNIPGIHTKTNVQLIHLPHPLNVNTLPATTRHANVQKPKLK